MLTAKKTPLGDVLKEFYRRCSETSSMEDECAKIFDVSSVPANNTARRMLEAAFDIIGLGDGVNFIIVSGDCESTGVTACVSMKAVALHGYSCRLVFKVVVAPDEVGLYVEDEPCAAVPAASAYTVKALKIVAAVCSSCNTRLDHRNEVCHRCGVTIDWDGFAWDDVTPEQEED